MKLKGIVAMAFVILVWGITFVNTRALLFDFSALEIQVIRFAMAWIALLTVERLTLKVERSAVSSKPPYHGGVRTHRPTDELLFAGMGLCGVFIYQLLENCAIYYTNASNVATGFVRTGSDGGDGTVDAAVAGRHALPGGRFGDWPLSVDRECCGDYRRCAYQF